MLKKIMGSLFILVVVFCFVGCSENPSGAVKIGHDGIYCYIDGDTAHLTGDRSKHDRKFENVESGSIKHIIIDDKIKLKNVKYLFCAYFGSNIISIDGLENLDISNATNLSKMLYECRDLQTLDLSGWDVSKVTDMSGMFSSCLSLQTLDISNWDVSNVTDMSEMFSVCRSLQTLDISNWDVSKVTDMSRMFSSCKSLQKLDISNWDVSNVTNMYGMFAYCDSLQKLNISNWDVSNVKDMSIMFDGCDSLTNIPNWYKE